jgi:hypothetical protein
MLAVALLPLAGARTASAGALFDKGFAEMQAHHYATACPALAESNRLEPHAGVLITVAECEYQWGHLTKAEELFESFMTLVGKMPRAEAKAQTERTKLAADRLTALAHDIPAVTLVTKPGSPPGSTVSLDNDTPTPPGTVRHVDPGTHVARIIGPSGASTPLDVQLEVGAERTIALELKLDAPPPPAEPAPPPDADPRRPWFIAAVVVGGAGLVTGGVLGAVALADKSTITAHCPTPSTCDSTGAVGTAQSAITIGWGSTAAFVVGVAGAGAAIALWATRPSSKQAALVPIVTPPLPGAHSYGSIGARLEF